MIRLARSIVGPGEAEAVTRVILEDGYLGMGDEVDAFEEELSVFLGVPRQSVACVASGTAALHLAVEAALVAGDEVLVPSLTYVATWQAIRAASVRPVGVEIIPASLTMDLRDAARRLTDRTRAIMPVHYASNPHGVDEVYSFAREHGLRVIEDAAHAFGCTLDGRKVGSFGDVACFSFDGIKNITSGEGGAVVSRDRVLMERVADARLLGVERDTNARFAGQRSWEFDVTRQGYRYHMSNLFAAVGRVQLRRLESEFAPKRIRMAEMYLERLTPCPDLTVPERDLGPVIPHIQPIRVHGGRRDGLLRHLTGHGVQTGMHYKPNHLLTLFGGGAESLPVTERLWAELLSLPLHPGLGEDDVSAVCDLVISYLENVST